MNLSEAELGDQYRIFVDKDGNMLDSPSMYTLLATVIGVNKPETKSGNLILGWLQGEAYPRDASARGKPSPENNYVPNQASYVYGKGVKRTLNVAIQIVNGLDGFPCKKCTNFYPLALPNQEDGTLICWSCRNRW